MIIWQTMKCWKWKNYIIGSYKSFPDNLLHMLELDGYSAILYVGLL